MNTFLKKLAVLIKVVYTIIVVLVAVLGGHHEGASR